MSMSAEELLAQVESLGVAVALDRDRLVLRPRSVLPPDLVTALRAHRDELRALVELRGWPEASREAVRCFGAPHARLYPFLGRTVATPAGLGRLVQVFTERAAVLFDDGAGRRIQFFLPSELRPPAGGAATASLVEGAVH